MDDPGFRRVYRISPGNIKRLRISSEPLKMPLSTEVQIRVKAIGLNFADLFAVWGLYSATPRQPFIPGLEFSGIVRVSHPGSKFKSGDQVMAVTKFGAYADYVNLDERYVFPLPENWNYAEGASFLVQVLTAYYALFELGNLTPEQTVLIHSGAGGVGLLANRLAKKSGAFTIGTTGSRAKVELMRREGYDAVIVRSKTFAQDLKEILGQRSLNLILECIGGRILKQGFNQLGPEGRMVVYGAAHLTSPGDRPNYLRMLLRFLIRPMIDPMNLPTTNRSILGFNLIYLYEKVDKMRQMLGKISEFKLSKPLVGSTFAFERLPDALRSLRSGKTVGKVIVEI
jgi:alcohol dehydrogenase